MLEPFVLHILTQRKGERQTAIFATIYAIIPILSIIFVCFDILTFFLFVNAMLNCSSSNTFLNILSPFEIGITIIFFFWSAESFVASNVLPDRLPLLVFFISLIHEQYCSRLFENLHFLDFLDIVPPIIFRGSIGNRLLVPLISLNSLGKGLLSSARFFAWMDSFLILMYEAFRLYLWHSLTCRVREMRIVHQFTSVFIFELANCFLHQLFLKPRFLSLEKKMGSYF